MGKFLDLILLCCGISPRTDRDDPARWDRLRAQAGETNTDRHASPSAASETPTGQPARDEE
ncbi:MAG: hypothetical protein AAGI30_09985 [Planctomycetota bacterium]